MIRPKDFPSPFPKEDRKVVVTDRIWFAPEEKTSSFVFPGFDNAELFGRKAPICLEYCSGNGLWIATKAKETPEFNWFGVEMKYKRIRKIWSKIKNETLPNLVGVCGEAVSWTKRFVPDASVHRVFINFPDPWPKKKHTKYRLVNPAFIEEMARIIEPSGEVMIVTDHFPYSESALRFFMESPHFTPKAPAPHYLTEYEGYGTSYFEELWRERGLGIHYLPFIRT